MQLLEGCGARKKEEDPLSLLDQPNQPTLVISGMACLSQILHPQKTFLI